MGQALQIHEAEEHSRVPWFELERTPLDPGRLRGFGVPLELHNWEPTEADGNLGSDRDHLSNFMIRDEGPSLGSMCISLNYDGVMLTKHSQ